MEGRLRAVEVNGTIDEQNRLHLDELLPISGPSRVRVIILFPESGEIDEQEWLRAAAMSPSLDFLKDPAEDVYSLSDGVSFHDEG